MTNMLNWPPKLCSVNFDIKMLQILQFHKCMNVCVCTCVWYDNICICKYHMWCICRQGDTIPNCEICPCLSLKYLVVTRRHLVYATPNLQIIVRPVIMIAIKTRHNCNVQTQWRNWPWCNKSHDTKRSYTMIMFIDSIKYWILYFRDNFSLPRIIIFNSLL